MRQMKAKEREIIDKKYKAFEKGRSEEQESLDEEERKHSEQGLKALQGFIKKHPRDESSLTAILAFCHEVMGGHEKSFLAALNAVQQLRKNHPQSWQGRISAHMEARLLYGDARRKTDGSYKSEKERTLNAYSVVKAALPEAEPQMDWNDLQLVALLQFIDPTITPPLRGGYLNAIAQCEGNLFYAVYKSSTVDERIQWLEKSKATYQIIVDEFPQSPQAKQAQDRIKQNEELIIREKKRAKKE